MIIIFGMSYKHSTLRSLRRQAKTDRAETICIPKKGMGEGGRLTKNNVMGGGLFVVYLSTSI